MTTNIEYNRIHALARARKVVMQKFGPALLHYWPMSDDTPFIRDLLRQKALFGNGVSPQSAGMLDYGVNVQSGYITDDIDDTGSLDSSIYSMTGQFFAFEIPVGAWRRVEYTFNITPYDYVTAYVAPAGLNPNEVAGQAIAASSQSGYRPSSFAWDFPYIVLAPPAIYWLYLCATPTNATLHGEISGGIPMRRWDGSTWSAPTQQGTSTKLFGADAEAWSSCDKFTVGVLVNVDNSPVNGYAFCLASNEGKVYLRVMSDKKVEGYIKNTNGAGYSVTSSRALHPGFNLLTLSYERNVAVKLGINGSVVATATLSDNYPVLNDTIAVGIGAMKLVGGAAIGKLKDAVIDDVFLAQGVISDQALWDVYMAYITAAPLMQVEDVTAA